MKFNTLLCTHSPVYIDKTANLRMTAQRIIWGKCVCAGQTCVSPDYLLCTVEIQEKLIVEFKRVLKEFYGENLQDNQDLSRIINARHFGRLRRMINETKGKVAIGGSVDEYDLWIEPTVIGNSIISISNKLTNQLLIIDNKLSANNNSPL